ncbi:MAG: hypothetical protein KAY65_14230 [Planctomycetes bacterium]|nr:hypothetical protein [Planctomycetota bacterium]
MKVWQVQYKGHDIRVENRLRGEKLIVDGKIQDEGIGMGFRSRMYGRIKNGDGAGEKIKVSLGGWFGIDCRIFIDDELTGEQK